MAPCCPAGRMVGVCRDSGRRAGSLGTFQAKESDIKEFSHGAFEMAKKVKGICL